MSNLQPEVHINKHGVPVTKHVRVDPLSGAAQKTIPSPVASLSPTARAERAASEFESFGEYDHDAPYLKQNFRFIAEHQPRLLDEIMTAARALDPEALNVLRFVVGEEKEFPLEPFYDDEAQEEFLAENMPDFYRFVRNASLATKLFPEYSYPLKVHSMRRLARKAEGVVGWAPRQAKKYPEVQAAMILYQTSSYKLDRISGHGDDIWFIADNIEKVIPLLPELKERNQTSKGLIEAMLENSSSALSDGVL